MVMVVVIGVLKLEWSRKGRAGVELEEVKISAAAKKLVCIGTYGKSTSGSIRAYRPNSLTHVAYTLLCCRYMISLARWLSIPHSSRLPSSHMFQGVDAVF